MALNKIPNVSLYIHDAISLITYGIIPVQIHIGLFLRTAIKCVYQYISKGVMKGFQLHQRLIRQRCTYSSVGLSVTFFLFTPLLSANTQNKCLDFPD